MITVLKLTIANIKQKKFRTALIVLSIILSVSLLYTVMSLSSQVTSIFEQKVKKEVGNAQLMILPEENSGEQYLTELDFENLQGMDYQIPLINAYGYSKIDEDMLPVVFSGMSIEDYRTIYGLDFIEKNTEQLSGDQVFIGEESAEVYKLKLGDKLEVTINNKPFSFTIEGIIKDKNNNLGYNLGSLSLITPKNTLANILGISNKVSAYYIKTDKQTTITEEQAKLSEAFPEEKINDVTDMSDFKQSLQMITTSLFLMVTAVIIVSAFIIYSSFKIIAIERMPLMGTLRSIGATRKVTIWTLL